MVLILFLIKRDFGLTVVTPKKVTKILTNEVILASFLKNYPVFGPFVIGFLNLFGVALFEETTVYDKGAAKEFIHSKKFQKFNP